MVARHMTLAPNKHTSVGSRVIEDVEVQQEVDVPNGAERADVVVACLGIGSQATPHHTVRAKPQHTYQGSSSTDSVRLYGFPR